MPTKLTVVKGSEDTETTPKRKPSFYRVFADRLRNWEPQDYFDEFEGLLEMLQDAQIPKRYKAMMVRAVVAAYINFDYMEDGEKDAVVDTIESLDGVELVSEIYRSSSRDSRTYILLHHLGHHIHGGLRR